MLPIRAIQHATNITRATSIPVYNPSCKALLLRQCITASIVQYTSSDLSLLFQHGFCFFASLCHKTITMKFFQREPIIAPVYHFTRRNTWHYCLCAILTAPIVWFLYSAHATFCRALERSQSWVAVQPHLPAVRFGRNCDELAKKSSMLGVYLGLPLGHSYTLIDHVIYRPLQ